MKTKHFKLMLMIVSMLFYTTIEAQIDTQEAIDSIATKPLKIETPEDENERETDNTADKVIRELTTDDNSNNDEPELPPLSEEDLDYEDSELPPQLEENLNYEDTELPPELGEDLDYEDSELPPEPEEDLDYEDSELPPELGEDLDHEDSELPPASDEDLDYEDSELPPVSDEDSELPSISEEDLDYEDSELPATDKDLDNKDKIDISYAVDLLKQEKNKGAVPTCVAMIVSWREGVKVSPMEIVAGVGYWEQFSEKAYSASDHKLFDHWKLKIISEAQNYPVDFFAKILENGPLYIILYNNEKIKMKAGVLLSMRGDGTPEGTSVTIYEPTKISNNKYTITYKEFDENRTKLFNMVKENTKKDDSWRKKEIVFIAY